jgi:dimethylhistidine N-methyltransferase
MTRSLRNRDSQDELSEIVTGLSQSPKMISPKYFYDERGSKLFEQICELPEYYLTRTEIGIMRSSMDEISALAGRRARVIEYGIGSGLKTRILLEGLDDPVAFIPIDISTEHLADSCRELMQRFPDIEILPVAADFTRPVPIPETKREPMRNLVYFPGSTIGNFEPRAALELLRVMHHEAGPGGALLIGTDLRKDPKIIESAYNDNQGVTAEFNLNVLRHLNRAFGSNFDPGSYRHKAVYDAQSGRIEMRLVSQRDQQVSLGGHLFSFAGGEIIITEYCHKFSEEGFHQLAWKAGFEHVNSWTDSNHWFSIQLYERR